MDTQSNLKLTEQLAKEIEERNRIESTIYCSPHDEDLVKSNWPLHTCIVSLTIPPGEVVYYNKDFFVLFKLYTRPTPKKVRAKRKFIKKKTKRSKSK